MVQWLGLCTFTGLLHLLPSQGTKIQHISWRCQKQNSYKGRNLQGNRIVCIDTVLHILGGRENIEAEPNIEKIQFLAITGTVILDHRQCSKV